MSSNKIGDTNLAFEEEITGNYDALETQTVDNSDLEEKTETLNESKKKKVPRRIIHFVDGSTMAEYSTDEEDDDLPPPVQVNPKTLNWLPWLWFWVVLCGVKSLAAADFLGEKLAAFFGITTPKYQYIIDEYYKMKQEEEEEQRLAAASESGDERELSSLSTSDINTTGNELPGSDSSGYNPEHADVSTDDIELHTKKQIPV